MNRIGTQQELEEFIGTREELVASGLVRGERLPGAPGMPSLSATFYGGELVRRGARKPKDEHYLRIQRLGRGRYLVSRGLSAQQRERRQARADAAFELERARLDAQEALERLPASVEQYRERCLGELKAHLAYLRGGRLDPNEYGVLQCGGYRYDEESLDAFDDAVSELIGILRRGHIRHSRARHDAVVHDIQARVARADQPLQEALAQAIGAVAIHRADTGESV